MKEESLTPPASDEEGEEKAAIEYARLSVNGRYMLAHHHTRYLLTAYDRVTRERDEARCERDQKDYALIDERKATLSERVASDRTIEQRDARIKLLENRVLDLLEEVEALTTERDHAESQLAARADAKPLGWVNVYSADMVIHNSREGAESIGARNNTTRLAVPVYEHPPAVSASVNEANPMESYNATRRGTAIRSWEVDSAGNITVLREDDTFWASHRGNKWAYITNAPTAEVPRG